MIPAAPLAAIIGDDWLAFSIGVDKSLVLDVSLDVEGPFVSMSHHC